MTYTEAVKLALSGEERGFDFLYQSTYKSKLYLALQYMKNEEDAKDILQDAYIKAFSRLDSLQDPERFPAWLGQIVANTAKNALVKKNPILFSDIPSQEEEEPFELGIEDDDMSHQPELAYTKEETRQLVRELMDSLSEEQRICVLMFHIEGASIREIAEALNCSENTVKSRLNYGRKNIKRKADDLQKKGYRLYGVAPLPLLLWLLGQDASAMSAEPDFESAGEKVADHVFQRLSASGKVISAAGHAAGSGLLHTAAGKALVAVIGAVVIGGSAAGVAGWMQYRAVPAAEEVIADETALEPEIEAAADPEEEPVSAESKVDAEQLQSVADEDYPDLLEGELTREELEFVLAYGPEELTETGLSDTEYEDIRNRLCQSSANGLNMLTEYGYDASYRRGYSVSEINRLFSVFTDFRFTEENDSDTQYGTDVDKDTIWVSLAELNFTSDAVITDAYYTEEEMTINFHFHKVVDDMEFSATTDTDKTAILLRNANGNFQIVRITEAESSANVESNAKQASAGTSDADAIREIYEGVLQDVSAGKYTFPSVYSDPVEGYYYFATDMDDDGVLELIVAAEHTWDVFYWYDCLAFDVESSVLIQADGDTDVLNILLPAESGGLYAITYLARGSGTVSIGRISIQDYGLVTENICEYSLEDAEYQQLINSHSYAEWLDITDLSGLDQIN